MDTVDFYTDVRSLKIMNIFRMVNRKKELR